MRLTLAKSCPLKAGKTPEKAGGKWFCDQCQEDVNDISGMTADDAARFLRMRGSDQSMCGEWATDSEGNVLFNLGRAAAAAAAIFVAAPAMADGLDNLPETALIALFGEHGAKNVRQDIEGDTNAVSAEPAPPFRPVNHYRGRMVMPTRQPPAPVAPTTPSKP